MRPRVLIFAIILLILFGSAFYWRNEHMRFAHLFVENLKFPIQQISDFYNFTVQGLRQIEKTSFNDLVTEIEKQVSTPPPLRAVKDDPKALLTKAGVIQWTNTARTNYGLPPLTEKLELNLAAAYKAQDMLEKQYFAHVSPSGAGPAELAEKVSYEFIAIGENLALGNFKNDQELVDGWMNSPGHRANILSTAYLEIGVAVVQGIFEGKKTWVAVQEFAKPISVCPQIDQSLKTKIENYEDQLKVLDQTLVSKRAVIESSRPKRTPEYLETIKEYNNLVEKYNDLIAELKALITIYNTQVKLFNECVMKSG